MQVQTRNALLLVFVGCSSSVPTDPIPKHQTFKMDSSNVGEVRTICVWTPPGYETSKVDYPVLFMPDGGIKEDFPHIANTVADLIKNNSIPPLILVGIENTERRRDLTGPSSVASDEEIAPLTDGATKFRSFIKEELFAEINERYRTNGYRGIIGESAAGLFVVETLFLQPEMFDLYVAMDPALHWNDGYLVRSAAEQLSHLPDSPLRFWFAGSGAADVSPHTRELKKILQEHAPASLLWSYQDSPDEQHNTIFRATKNEALKWAYQSLNKTP